jgi:hypothetical protein
MNHRNQNSAAPKAEGSRLGASKVLRPVRTLAKPIHRGRRQEMQHEAEWGQHGEKSVGLRIRTPTSPFRDLLLLGGERPLE